MITVLAWMTFVVPLMGGLLVWRRREAAYARTVAVWTSGVSVVSAFLFLLSTVFGAVPLGVSLFPGFLHGNMTPALPLFVAIVGFAAVALNPIATGSGTFARILWLNATTSLAVLVREPFLLSGLWMAQIVLVLLELRSRPATWPTMRLCAVYLLPSGVCAIAAVVLLTYGLPLMASYALLLAVGIRTAIVPTHSWLPEFVERAPMGTVVAFVSPLFGIYYSFCLLGDTGFGELSALLSVLAVTTALFAGALGVVQSSARRALGYILVSESAFVAFGLGAHADAGNVATVSAWVAVGFTTAGFAMVVAALEARRGTLVLDQPTGTYERIPLLATAFLVLGLASVGLPGTFGFVAEDLLFGAAIEERPWLTMALIGSTALNGVTVVRCFFYLFMGRRDHAGERDLLPREWIALTLLIGALIAEGLFPNSGIHWLSAHGNGADHTHASSAHDTVPSRP